MGEMKGMAVQSNESRDNLRKRQIKLLRPLVLCALALTCHWGWEHIMLYAPLVSHLPKNTSAWFANNISLLLVFVFIFIFHRTIEKYFTPHSLLKLILFGAIPEALGLLIRFFLFSRMLQTPEISGTISHVFTCLSDCAIAFGLAILILASIRAVSLFRREEQETLLSAATVASLVVYVFVCALTGWLQIAFIACLPIVVAFSLGKIKMQGDARVPPRLTNTNKLISDFPLIDLFALAFIAMTLNFIRGLESYNAQVSTLDIFSPLFAILSVLIAVLLLLCILAERHFLFPIKPLVVLFLGILSFLSYLLLPENAELSSIFAFSAFFIYVTILYRTIARHVNPLRQGWCRTVAIGLIFNCVGLTLGSSISHILNASTTEWAPYVVVGIVMVVMLFESALRLYREERAIILRTSTAASGSKKAEYALNIPEENLSAKSANPPTQSLAAVLEADSYILADAYGLTKREREVLILLASGRSIQGIAERIHVSDNTAKSHCTAIYRKLGIHGKEEVFAFFEQADEQRMA